MLQPWGKGLLATTLRYPYEVRDAESYFDDIGEIHIPKDMLALAEHILDSKAADFDASKFHDRYEAAVVAIVNEKKAGLPVSVQRQIPRIVAGTDLMAALRQSIEAEAPRVAIKIRRLRCAGGAIVVGVVMSPSTPDSPRDPDDLRRLADDLRRDVAFVPLQCEFFALEGLSQLLTTVEQVRRTLNQALTIHGVVLTMYDPQQPRQASRCGRARVYGRQSLRDGHPPQCTPLRGAFARKASVAL